MLVSEVQRNSAHRQYRQLMFRQMMMWLVGVSVPVGFLIAVFMF